MVNYSKCANLWQFDNFTLETIGELYDSVGVDTSVSLVVSDYLNGFLTVKTGVNNLDYLVLDIPRLNVWVAVDELGDFAKDKNDIK